MAKKRKSPKKTIEEIGLDDYALDQFDWEAYRMRQYSPSQLKDMEWEARQERQRKLKSDRRKARKLKREVE